MDNQALILYIRNFIFGVGVAVGTIVEQGTYD